MSKAIFLDRDGVVNTAIIKNGLPFSPLCLNEVKVISGVKEAIGTFKTLGYIPVIVTNQPEVARGNLKIEELERMNSYLRQELGILKFYSCTHDDLDACECRKPKPGMFLQAAKELKLDLRQSLMVGDRWKDIEAGQRAGCKCFFIDNSYQEPLPNAPFTRVTSLSEVLTCNLRS